MLLVPGKTGKYISLVLPSYRHAVQEKSRNPGAITLTHLPQHEACAWLAAMHYPLI